MATFQDKHLGKENIFFNSVATAPVCSLTLLYIWTALARLTELPAKEKKKKKKST